MKTADKPCYIFYIIGFPMLQVSFFEAAGEKLGINVKVKYHGCIIESYEVVKGVWMTAPIPEEIRIKADNEKAVVYYNNEIGKDWIQKVMNLAQKLMEDQSCQYTPF